LRRRIIPDVGGRLEEMLRKRKGLWRKTHRAGSLRSEAVLREHGHCGRHHAQMEGKRDFSFRELKSRAKYRENALLPPHGKLILLVGR
jgi:hypothetical protein